MPKGTDLGMPYVRKFAEEAKFEGLVQSAVERTGIGGTVKTGSQRPSDRGLDSDAREAGSSSRKSAPFKSPQYDS
jgi:hypothetical protein